jgi:hypothetical protein
LRSCRYLVTGGDHCGCIPGVSIDTAESSVEFFLSHASAVTGRLIATVASEESGGAKQRATIQTVKVKRVANTRNDAVVVSLIPVNFRRASNIATSPVVG